MFPCNSMSSTPFTTAIECVLGDQMTIRYSLTTWLYRWECTQNTQIVLRSAKSPRWGRDGQWCIVTTLETIVNAIVLSTHIQQLCVWNNNPTRLFKSSEVAAARWLAAKSQLLAVLSSVLTLFQTWIESRSIPQMGAIYFSSFSSVLLFLWLCTIERRMWAGQSNGVYIKQKLNVC